jgi:hypothetical protein
MTLPTTREATNRPELYDTKSQEFQEFKNSENWEISADYTDYADFVSDSLRTVVGPNKAPAL